MWCLDRDLLNDAESALFDRVVVIVTIAKRIMKSERMETYPCHSSFAEGSGFEDEPAVTEDEETVIVLAVVDADEEAIAGLDEVGS